MKDAKSYLTKKQLKLSLNCLTVHGQTRSCWLCRSKSQNDVCVMGMCSECPVALGRTLLPRPVSCCGTAEIHNDTVKLATGIMLWSGHRKTDVKNRPRRL